MSIARQIGLIVLLAAIATGGYAGYRSYVADSPDGGGDGARRGRGANATAVTLATTRVRRVEQRIEAVGTTRALQAINVVPMTSGRVIEVTFKPGDQVASGEVLARLDDDIEQADLAEATAKLAEATLALERARTLSESNTISRASLEQLTAARASAQAAVDRAQRRLADRTVRAPFAGIVGLGQVEVGARVDDDTMITTLDDLSRIEIEFSLPETVFGQVRPALKVIADSAAFPGRTFSGEVASIDSRIDPASRSFKVRAVVPNEDLALPAGMFMHLEVVLNSRDALMIPEESVVVEGDATFVFVVDNDKALRRDVSLGKRELGSVEVTDGLAENESIVVRGVQSLRDGAVVRPVGADGGDTDANANAGEAPRPARG